MEAKVRIRSGVDDVVHVLGHFAQAAHVAADELYVRLLGQVGQPRFEAFLVSRHQVKLGLLVVDLVEVRDRFANPGTEEARSAGYQ